MRINIALMALVLLLAIPIAQAKTVTLNYAFTIGDDKDNIITVNNTAYNASITNISSFSSVDDKIIIVERAGTSFGLVFAGSNLLNISFNTSHSFLHYLIQMKQNGEANKFLLAFTNGTKNDIYRNYAEKKGGIPSKTFGNVSKTIRQASQVFIRAEYDSVKIVNKLRFDGPLKLLIRNTGVNDGLANISFSLLSGG